MNGLNQEQGLKSDYFFEQIKQKYIHAERHSEQQVSVLCDDIAVSVYLM